MVATLLVLRLIGHYRVCFSVLVAIITMVIITGMVATLVMVVTVAIIIMIIISVIIGKIGKIYLRAPVIDLTGSYHLM